MTPKEKAQELYDKIHFALPSYHDEGQQEHKSAKECAIITVSEILKACDDVHDSSMVRFEETGMGEFWIKVKEEINKL